MEEEKSMSIYGIELIRLVLLAALLPGDLVTVLGVSDCSFPNSCL